MTDTERSADASMVVLVHGLYMHGLAMLALERRLEACGFPCRRFNYPSVKKSVAENASRLERYLRDIDAPVVHFLCHSLGGLVVRAMLLQSDWQRPGRVLTLGTPHLGCHVAKRLAAAPSIAWLLGKSFVHGLDGDLPPWPGDRQVATIVGDVPVGAGRVVRDLAKPNDGTVAVKETVLGPGYPHVVIGETHTSLLFSRRAARFACTYFANGHLPGSEEEHL